MITPLAETKLESLAAGDILFKVSTSDPDTQTHSYRFACTPRAAEDTFTLDSGNLTLHIYWVFFQVGPATRLLKRFVKF